MSAPLDKHPKRPVPLGREKTWISKPPMCPQPSTPPARAQHPGRGGADLCVRSTGQTSENPRSDGQPRIMDRPTPRWAFGLNTPGIGSALACIRSFATPWGEKVPEGGMRGQPARGALCQTPTNHPFLSPSPQPSPTVTRYLLLGSLLVGEGATRGGAASEPPIGFTNRHEVGGMGRPPARHGSPDANHPQTSTGQQPPAVRSTNAPRHPVASPLRRVFPVGCTWRFRFRSLGCPSKGFTSDASPTERTQRSAPPATRV